MKPADKTLKDPELAKFIKISAIKDVSNQSLVALPIIALFEILMIVYWCLFFKHNTSLGSAGYLVSYISLLVVSVVCFFVMRHERRDCEKNYIKMMLLQNFYAVMILAWALTITILDVVARGSFSVIVYITIIVIVPVFCYVDFREWATLHVISTAIILTLAVRYYDRARGFFINFMVFTIITIIAQRSFNTIKRDLYIRQYELIKTREEEYIQAHNDELTGLMNRRSYNEKLEELEKKAIADDIVVVSLDVNGLKLANDTMGHKAGDELLNGAAETIKNAFSPYGSVYRTGGDEFMAILEVSDEDLGKAKETFDANIKAWKGQYCQSLSVSAGFASHRDNKSMSIAELEIAADAGMYEAKRRYYEQNGIERRKHAPEKS